MFAAQLYGHFVHDRLPLWVCARQDGVWKPEYRLHALWFPALIVQPVGLGLFGASLQYHLHYMVLALASFLITYASIVAIPISINYLIECFPRALSAEVAAILNLYRLVLGISITFFIFSWAERVGNGWVFGMMAFFTLFASCFMLSLVPWGPQIRRISLVKDVSTKTDEGVKVINKGEDASDLGA